MSKLSKRLFTIANLVDKNHIILDVGTDHGLIPIFLVNNNIVKKAYATDISKKAIDKLKKIVNDLNLVDKVIPIHNEGLNNITFRYDTLIISGMGYYTIKSITQNKNLPTTLIIQSNSKLKETRKFFNNLGYKIKKEVVVFEKNKYYVIIKYIKKRERLSYFALNFGKSNNKNYYIFLKKKNYNLLKNVPVLKKWKYLYKCILLQIKIYL